MPHSIAPLWGKRKFVYRTLETSQVEIALQDVSHTYRLNSGGNEYHRPELFFQASSLKKRGASFIRSRKTPENFLRRPFSGFLLSRGFVVWPHDFSSGLGPMTLPTKRCHRKTCSLYRWYSRLNIFFGVFTRSWLPLNPPRGQ